MSRDDASEILTPILLEPSETTLVVIIEILEPFMEILAETEQSNLVVNMKIVHNVLSKIRHP